MSAPVFSIVIPSFNSAATLEETIDSVLGQTPGLAEVIVIDGGSTDGTLAILDSYGDKIRYISEPDRGIYDAMNKGIDLAQGQYINFQGAGDKLRPGILERISGAMPTALGRHVPSELPPGPTMVYGKVWIVDQQRIDGEEFSKMTLRNGNIPHQAVFYSRDLFDTVGRYDLKYPVLADYALCLQCFGDDRVRKLYVDEVVADYLGGGVSTQRHDDVFYADLGGLIRKNLGARAYWTWRLQKLVPMSIRRARAARRSNSPE